MTSTALVRPVSSVALELRAAWATGRRVALSLERADFERLEGIVTRVAASGSYVVVRGRHVPLERVLAVHWPSRLGDSTFRGGVRWAGAGKRWEPQQESLWRRVLGTGGNSRDFAFGDELGMLEFGAAWSGLERARVLIGT